VIGRTLGYQKANEDAPTRERGHYDETGDCSAWGRVPCATGHDQHHGDERGDDREGFQQGGGRESGQSCG
jgi:hypothetical protein